jgi:Ca-activated chloride channel family protein
MKYRFRILALSICAFSASAQDAIFREDVKLVEIYATVLDRGRPVDGLKREQFEVRDDGTPQPIRVFEPSETALSCALMLDVTGSMRNAMPELRSAARNFIATLRPNDRLAIDTFTDHVQVLQEMSTDRLASQRALTRLHAGGRTALFDAISEVSLDLEQYHGKKVIVVLTDGGDNASVLNRQAAAQRARKSGVPVFAIAEGDALRDGTASGLLRDLTEATGGREYKAKDPKDVEAIFRAIAHDLEGGYLLAFKAPDEQRPAPWHEIKVLVKNVEKPVQVRARTGYPAD